ncbi:MAG TPA: DNA polymerase III subunit delta' [Pyrinomonadaceae bacterium]|nr:DNA polymerase III subunit delta' [Pyrinomonadaceae bacterium]
MFSNLIGNEEVKKSLQRLLANGRLPGSLLFTGEEGVGKKLFALELAKILNCKARRGVEACAECSSCKRISNSTFPPFNNDDDDKTRLIFSEHADVAMVRPYKQIIRVGPIRELEREANFRPFEGAGRLFIIEDADYMNDQAANALLKTLEEPEPTTHLVLTTSNPSALPATIRSRCQTIQFAPIRAGEIEAFLRDLKGVSPKDAPLLARTSRGSLGRACAGDIDTYRERREAMMTVLVALTVDGNHAALLRSAEELAAIKERDEYEQSLDVLQVLIRDAWALSLGRPKESIVNIDLLDQLQTIAADLGSAQAAAWLQQIEELRGALEVNINRKIASDALLLSMSEPGRTQGPYARWKP